VQRYIVENRKSLYFAWRFNNKCTRMPPGKVLRIILQSPAMVHWSFDAWQSSQNTNTVDTDLETHVADLPSDKLASGRQIVFTVYWQDEQRWEGVDFSVVVED
jgi:glucoamylase